MHRSLIVARILPGSESEVAQVFGESDQTELPHIAGVRRRELYSLGDVYIHVIETRESGGTAIAAAREHPEFSRVSRRLEPFISPYLSTWKSPRDAVAGRFYTWEPEGPGQ